ncbi:tyrosine-type recombinase/integrase [Gymnodinialimonas ceratoperidinii]|uniref:Tyrosine-type recombinase/integrase n=1 Tax=Gymnodinialimonas ceratoperidinii TaxID=2856823 RepID=A0A8F6TW55_9RHOB|nr:tyrosine-type recombinase/integrase [Gymnodinialimonas ceratoperidinii]QXT40046.1 tyrosine-type recombinase/integrase [Gymnodinialimonas ceratoperidinii]
MVVMMKLNGLTELSKGKWEFRRRVPKSAKAALGKGEWKRVIKARSDADLFRQYALVEAEFERDVATASKPKRKLTARAVWEEALREESEVIVSAVGLSEDEAREVILEGLLKGASAGEDDVGGPDVEPFSKEDALEAVTTPPIISRGRDFLLAQALLNRNRPAPAMTLEDAREVYVKESLGGGEAVEHRPAMVRLERVMRLAAEAGLPASTPLVGLTREHARKVRDHMASRSRQGSENERVSPASVKRELGLLRTMISYGGRELGLLDLVNPFEKLPIEGATAATGARVSAREKVDPLPSKIAAAMRTKLSNDLLLIWRLLEGTGCRLGEVTGLRVSDVRLDAETPHLRIEWHEGRRLKTLSSIRSVPLIGVTLEAANEAVGSAAGGELLFPRYARERGADAASAALMKHLRSFTTDKRHKVHSLRHGMKDRMRKAGVDKAAQDVVLGHAAPNIGETYGGSEGLLAVALRALRAVESFEAGGAS